MPLTPREVRLKRTLDAATRIGGAMASGSDVRLLLDEVVELARELFEAGHASLYLKEGQEYVRAASAGDGQEMTTGIGGLAKVVRTPDGQRVLTAPLSDGRITLGALVVIQTVAPADASDEEDLALLSSFSGLAASLLRSGRELRMEQTISAGLARLGSCAAAAELARQDSVEAILREIAGSLGASGAAVSMTGHDGVRRLGASWNVPPRLAAAWQSSLLAMPSPNNGFNAIAPILGEGPWSDIVVHVPRREGDTALHVIRAGTVPPSEIDLRLTAVVALQLGALLDRNELVAEIHASSEAERAAVHRLHELHDDIEEGILVVDAGGRVTFASRRTFKILQRSPNELIGHALIRSVEPDDRPALVDSILGVRAGARLRGEFRVCVGDGDFRVIDYTGRPDGPFSGAVRMVLRDVTEERTMVEEALHREKLVSMGLLAAGIAHEINNPISFVLSNHNYLARRLTDVLAALDVYRELARMPETGHYSGPLAAMEAGLELSGLAEDLPQILADSLEGLVRVQRIVADMRVFSRKDPESPLRVDVPSLIDTALGMAHSVSSLRAKVVRDVQPDIATIDAWPGRLTQCVLNLVVNAAQAIPRSAVADNTITVRAWSDDQAVFIAVSDTGSGIRPEDRARLFTPFFTTKSPGEGTGLGLALAWDTVRRLGGRISVESAVGKGSTFTMRLPFGGIRTAPEIDPSASLASEGLRLAG